MSKKNRSKTSNGINSEINEKSQVILPEKTPTTGFKTICLIILAALAAVMLSSYPVIFCGKSFVSPNSVNALVYSWWPPMPGMTSNDRFNQHGSDTGAVMWAMVPWSHVQMESIFEHGEIPFWNRYSHAGESLIGQGISQIGDPLHWIVLIARGEAIGWDIKYLVARFLFCLGFGLLVKRLIGGRLLPVAFAGLAAWSGAFFYTFSHPSFIVFSYTPWILLSAIRMLESTSGKSALWGGVWLLANVSCFNAGMLSVAVILIGGLNLVALAYAVSASEKRRGPFLKMGLGTFVFLGWTAPFWITFVDTQHDAFSLHMEVKVDQIPVANVAGVFDDIFYRVASGLNGVAPAPGASMLILVGCLLAVLNWKSAVRERFYWVNTVTIALWGGFVFGWVPASVISLVPFLNRVGHIATDFSYLLVFHLTLHSAYGFFLLAKNSSLKWHIIQFSIIVATIVCGFHFNIRTQSVSGAPWFYLLFVAFCAVAAPLLFAVLKSYKCERYWVGWIGIVFFALMPNLRYGLYTFGDDKFLMKPGARHPFDYPSESISHIKKSEAEPFRATGLQSSFIGNYPAVYGIEDIRSCSPLLNKPLVNLTRGFPGIEIVAWDWVIGFTDPVLAKPLFNLLNVKYLLAHPQTQIQGDIGFEEFHRGDFLVLKNNEAWPRAFYTNRILEVKNLNDFKSHLIGNAVNPFAAFSPEELSREPRLREQTDGRSSTVVPAVNYNLGPNSTSFTVAAPAAGVITLLETNARDFHVTVNGKSAPVLTVNQAFKAVYVDSPGNYTVEFRYVPAHWIHARILFGAALICTLVIGAWAFYTRRGVQPRLHAQS